MSFRTDYILYAKNNENANSEFSSGLSLTDTSPEVLSVVFSQCLQSGMHGLCFSMYEEGQKPGDQISEEQVRRRLKIMAPYTKWVRSFSCTEGNEFVPKIARELGMKTLVGAWLGDDTEKNEKEMEALIQLANEGYVDIAAVGNEVMYRKDLTEDKLLAFIQKVRIHP